MLRGIITPREMCRIYLLHWDKYGTLSISNHDKVGIIGLSGRQSTLFILCIYFVCMSTIVLASMQILSVDPKHMKASSTLMQFISIGPNHMKVSTLMQIMGVGLTI